MKVKYLGHSCFLFNEDGVEILVDPFISGNPKSPVSLNELNPNLILVTHDHPDHLGDAIEIAKKSKSQVICIFDLASELSKKGISVIAGNLGGTIDYKGIKITYVKAEHTSEHGVSVGYVIRFKNNTIYFAGDTNIFSDMNLIRELYNPDIALLPIDGHYNMGPYEASHAVRLLEPKIVIPMHYGTFPLLKGTPEQLNQEIKKQNLDVKMIIFNIGEEKEF